MRRSSAVPLGRSYLALAALAASAGLVAACGGSDDEQVYCADENGVIVDDDLCDDDDDDGRSRPYFLWVGRYGNGLKPGHRLSGGSKLALNDSAARARYGLSSSGKVTNGTVVSGGFGSSNGSAGG